MSLAPRLSYQQLAPKAFKGLLDFSATARSEALGARLVGLVLLRVSQINGCGFCVDMHWRELVAQGADQRHVNAVAGWHEAPFFDRRERAALRWAEAVAAIPARDDLDGAFKELGAVFTSAEMAELGFVIAMISAWNLMNVSFANPIPDNA